MYSIISLNIIRQKQRNIYKTNCNFVRVISLKMIVLGLYNKISWCIILFLWGHEY